VTSGVWKSPILLNGVDPKSKLIAVSEYVQGFFVDKLRACCCRNMDYPLALNYIELEIVAVQEHA